MWTASSEEPIDCRTQRCPLLVVEADLKWGALITARIALEYGVPVYAVPGDVDRAASVGTNILIRDGSFQILGAEDLTEVLTLLEPLYAIHSHCVHRLLLSHHQQ